MWATLKRAHKGAFHRFSPKKLHRYVDEFVGRNNFRDLDTLEQMAYVVAGMDASRLRCKNLVG
ncbi:MAG: transposase [Bryobacterales bacterium]|nr:transposase [Bryobacterales bacterium]